MASVARYGAASRSGDHTVVPELFSDDARYLRSPSADALVGPGAIGGRVEHFEEWAYWPDKPYTANPG